MVQTITNDLNSRIVNGQYTKLQVSQKVGRLKSNFKDFTMLLRGKISTEFGWDHVTKTVIGDEEQ
jgi:hypothetical protein